MPYAVTLPLDDDAADAVRQLWLALAEQAGADDMLRLGYPPHLTLAVLPDTAPATALAEAVSGLAEHWTGLGVTLAGLGVFPGAPPVVWAAPVVTPPLLARHAALHAALRAARPDCLVHEHYRPGAWVPHVTLSQRSGGAAGPLVEAAGSAWRGPIRAICRRLELVRFPPVAVLRSEPLAAAAAG
ncbi:2'-5' RNA ligase family protein [Teichococcus cervicalis]|uniref:2',5' RNA ligase family protein n=2 Tax=Teichococcus cervicalis TaxID=204525 RepID=D5RTJ4_9PROT|nr:2'-5' RNA ligase family protein [Pseudoroseomonas cervicalis]EFH09373.1 hypothetical protein HMPREF0731_4406 [Pseudoroseomonas cervicalis ATCC 49957]